MKKLLFLSVLLVSFGAVAKAQTDIRKIDFKNFTYEIQVFETKQKVAVKNGEYMRMSEDDKLLVNVGSVVYGDLNGDGKDEAVVSTVFNTGGTGNFSSGIIFTMRNGKPAVLTGFEGGDRAYGGIAGAKIISQTLIVERNMPGESGGACCAEYIETAKYKWNGTKLVQVGESETRELYPAARIAFRKGKTIAIIPVKLAKYDRKRFVVGVRKGQTLLVSSGIEPTNSVYYDLIKGEGETEKTDNGMIVKLKSGGDYVFEVSNSTEKGLSFSITVEIN